MVTFGFDLHLQAWFPDAGAPQVVAVRPARVPSLGDARVAVWADEIDRALRGYRDDGSIQRWLDDSVRDYRRLAGNRADAW